MEWTREEIKAAMNYQLREMQRLTAHQEELMERIEKMQILWDYDAELVFLRELTELLKKINGNLQDLTENVRSLNEERNEERREAAYAKLDERTRLLLERLDRGDEEVEKERRRGPAQSEKGDGENERADLD